jgi:hypothetical protein
MHEVAPSAVSTAETSCSIHFKVSFLLIRVFFFLTQISQISQTSQRFSHTDLTDLSDPVAHHTLSKICEIREICVTLSPNTLSRDP